MSRIADNQKIRFLWLCYEAVNTSGFGCQISTKFGRSNCLFLWLCQMLSAEETSHITECWCDCEWTHCKYRPLAIGKHLWKCSLALHDREFPLAAFPFWFSIIYECSSGENGCASQVSISLYDMSWLAAEQQFWNVFTARQTSSGWEDKCQKTHIWAEYKGRKPQWGKESLTVKQTSQENDWGTLGAKEWGKIVWKCILYKCDQILMWRASFGNLRLSKTVRVMKEG